MKPLENALTVDSVMLEVGMTWKRRDVDLQGVTVYYYLDFRPNPKATKTPLFLTASRTFAKYSI